MHGKSRVARVLACLVINRQFNVSVANSRHAEPHGEWAERNARVASHRIHNNGGFGAVYSLTVPTYWVKRFERTDVCTLFVQHFIDIVGNTKVYLKSDQSCLFCYWSASEGNLRWFLLKTGKLLMFRSRNCLFNWKLQSNIPRKSTATNLYRIEKVLVFPFNCWIKSIIFFIRFVYKWLNYGNYNLTRAPKRARILLEFCHFQFFEREIEKKPKEKTHKVNYTHTECGTANK